MEKFSTLKYTIRHDESGRGWYYEIYNNDGTTLLSVSAELFKNQGVARYAVIGHITLLENSFNHFQVERS